MRDLVLLAVALGAAVLTGLWRSAVSKQKAAENLAESRKSQLDTYEAIEKIKTDADAAALVNDAWK